MPVKYKKIKEQKEKLNSDKRLKEFREKSFMGRLLWNWNIPGKANNSRYSSNDNQK